MALIAELCFVGTSVAMNECGSVAAGVSVATLSRAGLQAG